MDELAVLRLTSSRPVYRRGGVALSNVPVDIQRGQDGGILTPEAMLALARDPVVKMHGSTDGETFTAITDAEREELAVALEALIEAKAAEVGNQTNQSIPSETGAAVERPANAQPTPAAGEGGVSAVGSAEAQAEAKEEPKGDPVPSPVAAAAVPAKANKPAKAGRGSK